MQLALVFFPILLSSLHLGSALDHEQVFDHPSSPLLPTDLHKNMAARPGGTTAGKPITDEAKDIALAVKKDIESKAGRTYETFDPVEYATQVVAGTNFFFKIDVGNGEQIHARVFRDLHKNLSVAGVQTGKTSSDPLVHF